MATSTLGRNLRTAREARGWSRETLSRESGTAVASISRTELYGHTPTLGLVYAWASALEVPLGEILPDELEETVA